MSQLLVLSLSVNAIFVIVFAAAFYQKRKKTQYQAFNDTAAAKCTNIWQKKTIETTEPDSGSEKLLNSLEQLFESEKIYRNSKLTINDVAGKLKTNRTRLSEVINSHCQKNFSEYVNHYRIQDAKRIFKAQNENNAPNHTIEQIAEEVGFGSPAPFYRAFKQAAGVTTSEYKKSLK